MITKSRIIIIIYGVFLIAVIWIHSAPAPYYHKQATNAFKESTPVQEAVDRVNEAGIDSATTKDIIIFTTSHLNDEIDNFGNRMLNGIWALVWVVAGGLFVALFSQDLRLTQGNKK